MDKVYLLGGLRSFVGVVNGMYRHVPAEKLGAAVLRQVMDKYGIEQPDYIIAGNGVGAGGNIARLMALEAGVDTAVPAFTIDVQCGSGLESIAVAAAKIASGEADCIIAGGFESSSTQPRRGYNANHPDYAVESWYSVAKFMPGIHRETVMLEGAELACQREQVSKAELDAWVLGSHRLAAQAQQKGSLQGIIAPCFGATKDEGIRPRISQRLLDRLPKVLEGGEFITAANSCLINDGAAFVVVCSEEYLLRHNLQAQAKILGSVACGGDPLVSPRTAVTALEKLLAKHKLTEADIDDFEINEAFAVIDVLFGRAFPRSVDKYNAFGGALAYGHPYGASGAIITLHLLEALKRCDGRLGCASVAAAGGIGTALLLERVEA
ncbi:MAG: thiolase family protein [Phascolarctobacterium sp.]|nr:thiolase family protein [Phascolarctobacterium sp.]